MTNIVSHFQLRGPLFLAPLAGGPSTPELVAAVCNAGALGFLGSAYSSPEILEKEALRVRALTSKPFGINLFIPGKTPDVSGAEFHRAVEATNPYRRELGLPTPQGMPAPGESFEEQFAMLLQVRPAAFSFVFGQLSAEKIEKCKELGVVTIGTATTLKEALALQKNHVDAVVLQGREAGGHRGIFDDHQEDPDVPTLPLVAQCKEQIHIPLIAAGGLMTGEDVLHALEHGAQAAQLGTAFLNCPEAGTSKAYRQRLLAGPYKTQLTRAFSGRLARGLENRFLLEMKKHPETILPFPVQNAFTRDLRKASAEQGSAEFLSLWAGTGVEKIRSLPAGELVREIFKELNHAAGRL